MGFADLGPVTEFVLTARADPHVVHAHGCEHPYVLFGHDRITVATVRHSEYLHSQTDIVDTSFTDLVFQAACLSSVSAEQQRINENPEKTGFRAQRSRP